MTMLLSSLAKVVLPSETLRSLVKCLCSLEKLCFLAKLASSWLASAKFLRGHKSIEISSFHHHVSLGAHSTADWLLLNQR